MYASPVENINLPPIEKIKQDVPAPFLPFMQSAQTSMAFRPSIFDIARDFERPQEKRFEAQPHGLSTSEKDPTSGVNAKPAVSGATPVKASASSELLGKMILLIQKAKGEGISKTTVEIHTKNPNSPYNGAHLSVDHYSTAPYSFNIQLSGSPQAILKFHREMGELRNLLNASLSKYQIQLLTPELHPNYRVKFQNTKRLEKKRRNEYKKGINHPPIGKEN